MDHTVSVWTFTDDPAWLARNAGIRDVLLVTGITAIQARCLVERLRMLYPADTFEIRDIRGAIVPEPGATAATSAAPQPVIRNRRKLSNRDD